MGNLYKFYLEKLGNQNAESYIGKPGDIWFDPDLSELRLRSSDGVTPGGADILDSSGNGYTGSAGATGFTGSAGTIGYSGSRGATGYQGSRGVIGFTGSSGDLGFTGSRGVVGYQGSAGVSGSSATFDTLSDLITTDKTYADFPENTILTVDETGFKYKVLASGSSIFSSSNVSGYHLITTGGGNIKLQVLPVNGFVHADAFNCDPTGVTECSDEFNMALQYCVAFDTPGSSTGTYKMGSTVAPGGKYVWHWGDTILNFASAVFEDLSEVMHNPSGASYTASGKRVLFDVKNCTFSVNHGCIRIVGSSPGNMRLASRTAIPTNVVAVTCSTTPAGSDMTWDRLDTIGCDWGLFQGNMSGSAANILPYTRWTVRQWYCQFCRHPFESGAQGTGFDDTFFEQIRLTRNCGSAIINNTDMGGGVIFNVGLKKETDMELETLSGTSGSNTVTLSSDNADLTVGMYIVIRNALPCKDESGTGRTLTARIDAKSGTTITLNRTLGQDITNTEYWADPPTIIATHATFRFLQQYHEDMHYIPVQLLGNSTIRGVIECSGGEVSSLYDCIILVNKRGVADVQLHAESINTAQLGATVGLASVRNGSTYYGGSARVISGQKYPDLLARNDIVNVVKLDSQHVNTAGGDIECSGEWNPELDIRIVAANGEYIVIPHRIYGSEPAIAFRNLLGAGPRLQKVYDITDFTANGNFSAVSGGTSVKTPGDAGYLFASATSSKIYLFDITFDDNSGGSPNIRFTNSGTTVGTSFVINRARRFVRIVAHAPDETIDQMRLYDFTGGDYTVSQLDVYEVAID